MLSQWTDAIQKKKIDARYCLEKSMGKADFDSENNIVLHFNVKSNASARNNSVKMLTGR
jgi:hypothetical protein